MGASVEAKAGRVKDPVCGNPKPYGKGASRSNAECAVDHCHCAPCGKRCGPGKCSSRRSDANNPNAEPQPRSHVHHTCSAGIFSARASFSEGALESPRRATSNRSSTLRGRAADLRVNLSLLVICILLKRPAPL